MRKIKIRWYLKSADSMEISLVSLGPKVIAWITIIRKICRIAQCIDLHICYVYYLHFSSHVPLFFSTKKISFITFRRKIIFSVCHIRNGTYCRSYVTFFVVCNWDSYQFRYMHNSDVYFFLAFLSFLYMSVITICTLNRQVLCTAYTLRFKTSSFPNFVFARSFPRSHSPFSSIGCANNFHRLSSNTHIHTRSPQREHNFSSISNRIPNHCYNSVHVARF